MIVYIAGKITGDENYREKFEAFAEIERERGHVVLAVYAVGRAPETDDYCSVCGKKLCSRFTNYCPNCGRPLTEEAWAELERRIGGNDETN